ncbi:MAG: Do family serine endopeptidase [Cyclobacteriaceae bacterium]|nr:Do family serine endopeptidase [Cyclobacteriaceae bacterium]
MFISAVTGGLIVLLSLIFFDSSRNKALSVDYRDSGNVKQALYTKNDDGEIVPIDFTVTAKLVNESVVSITSFGTPTASQGNQNIPEPFRDFFGDQWERFFQQPEQQPRSDEPRPIGSGSGVIINEDGYIVTNFHVIRNAERLSVTFLDNETIDAEVIGTDPTTDLALIKVDRQDLPSVALMNSDNVEVGEWVLAVGNPFNLSSTVTAGIVSAKARRINILTEQYAVESFIQTDAAINPGNSGGALVNLRGELVGINTAIASPTGSYAGYGFAVPSNLVKKVVNDLLEFGEVQRAVLGVTIRNNNSVLAEENNLETNSGVYIDSVMAGSAAEEGGIQEKDIIISVEGRDIETSAELMENIANRKPGEKIKLTVIRDGKEEEIEVTLKSLSGEREEPTASAENREILRDLGAEFRTLTVEESNELNVDGGVIIEKLFPGKLLRETRIREGFIITGVDKEKINSVDELVRKLEESEGGVLIEGKYPDDEEQRYFGLSSS